MSTRLPTWPTRLTQKPGSVWADIPKMWRKFSKARERIIRTKFRNLWALRFVDVERHREMQSSNKKTVAVVILAGLRGMRSSHGLCCGERKREQRGLFNKSSLGQGIWYVMRNVTTSLTVTLEDTNLKTTYSDIALDLDVFYGSHDRGLHSMAPHN